MSATLAARPDIHPDTRPDTFSGGLTPDQVAFYRTNGYLVVPAVFGPAELDGLRAAVAALRAEAAACPASDARFDIGPGHSAATPHLRRIKDPQRVHPAFAAAARQPGLLDRIADLIGPDIRFDHGKLNLKPPGGQAAIEWHQDWAFYPHTNDDLLAVGILLEDVDAANGPMMVIPGSHTGPVLDHHHAGWFVGACNPDDLGPARDRAVALTAPAGSVTLHHVRTVHASSENHSDRDRPLLLFTYRAVDAWPLVPVEDLASFDRLVLRGAPTLAPRQTALPVRLPLPRQPGEDSIYDNQKAVYGRSFGPGAAQDGAGQDGAGHGGAGHGGASAGQTATAVTTAAAAPATPAPTAAERAIRHDLAACYRLAGDRGWSDIVWNHITARVPDEPDAFLIKPHDLRYDEVTPAALLKIGLDGRPRGLAGDRPATMDAINVTGYVIHAAVLRARPDVACVLHTHTDAGLAFSCLHRPIEPLVNDTVMLHDNVGYHDYDGLSDDDSECMRIAAALGDHAALVLRHHGLLTVGRSVAEAFMMMFYLDRACRVQLEVLKTGVTVPPIPAALLARAKADYAGFWPGDTEWPALLREAESRLGLPPA